MQIVDLFKCNAYRTPNISSQSLLTVSPLSGIICVKRLRVNRSRDRLPLLANSLTNETRRLFDYPFFALARGSRAFL
jgi:hypothetical protein